MLQFVNSYLFYKQRCLQLSAKPEKGAIPKKVTELKLSHFEYNILRLMKLEKLNEFNSFSLLQTSTSDVASFSKKKATNHTRPVCYTPSPQRHTSSSIPPFNKQKKPNRIMMMIGNVDEAILMAINKEMGLKQVQCSYGLIPYHINPQKRIPQRIRVIDLMKIKPSLLLYIFLQLLILRNSHLIAFKI